MNDLNLNAIKFGEEVKVGQRERSSTAPFWQTTLQTCSWYRRDDLVPENRAEAKGNAPQPLLSTQRCGLEENSSELDDEELQPEQDRNR